MSDRQLFSNPDIETLSVGTVFRRSKNAIARDFRGQVWIEGELKFIKTTARGHWSLVLVDPGDFNDGGDIQLDVFVWQKKRLVIEAKLNDVGLQLASGMMVRVQGTVGISKIGKLQLELTDLDTNALVGRQEAEKRQLYKTLTAEGLLDAQKRMPVPLVPLRVGLVTSEGSEGFNDFTGQLTRAPFAFEVTFLHSAVQGPTAANTLARAIASFDPSDVDVICVVRGGGGELDAFDKEPVVRAIVTSSVPVWTGIGHTGDRAVADDVAQQFFITPTACGQAVVQQVAAFADRVRDNARRISRSVEQQLQTEAVRVHTAGRAMQRSTGSHLDRSSAQLLRAGERVHHIADGQLQRSEALVQGLRRDLVRDSTRLTGASAEALSRSVDALRAAADRRTTELSRDLLARRAHLSAFDPEQQLRRGYSITHTADGLMVRDVTDLKESDQLVTTFAGGTALSTVTELRPNCQ